MLPNYYEFQNSAKILSGKYAIENIPAELVKRNAKKILLLSDKTLEKIGTVKIVSDRIENNDCKLIKLYTDIPADSNIEIISEIAKMYKENGCDSIVALGGGSVIDTAKGVRMILSQKVENINELVGAEMISYGEHIPFVAIPTTSGTGSEVTGVAVILNKIEKVKMDFLSYYLLPDIAVIDPRMTKTLPARITASTGMDALCHAIEGYTCLQKNPMSDAYSISAIKLIGESLIKSVKEGDTKDKFAMANASMMSGVSFSNSMVGIVHAIGHALGGVSNVPHADAMNILLPFCMKYNLDYLRDDYSRLLLYLAGEDFYLNIEKEKRAEEFICYIEQMKEELNKLTGLPLTLEQAGVKKEDFDLIASKAINDGAMIVNPKEATKEDIISILEKAF